MANKQQVTDPKLFKAKWTERDEAIFLDLLKRKIGELKFEMRECESPYIRERLKEKRKEYILIHQKVTAGQYNSNILAAEMAIYQAAKTDSYAAREKGHAKYVDSYDDINFNFDTYFRKNRYYGAALPIVNLILVVLLFFTMFFGAIIPAGAGASVDNALFGNMNRDGAMLSFSAIGYIQLGAGAERDIVMPNNGNWPQRVVMQENQTLPEQGVLFEGRDEGAGVRLYTDLGIQAIYISTGDVLRSFFFTPAMLGLRIEFLENIFFDDLYDMYSWYAKALIFDREDMGFLTRDEGGNINWVGTVNFLATYGLIYLLLILFLLIAIELVITIIRMFTHTARRFRFIPFLALLVIALIFIAPVFATIPSLDGATVNEAFSSYFSLSWNNFIEGDGGVNINILTFAVALFVPILILLMPAFFKNKAVKGPTKVPKGNRPHTFEGHEIPTTPGGIPQDALNKKGKKGKNTQPTLAPTAPPTPSATRPKVTR